VFLGAGFGKTFLGDITSAAPLPLTPQAIVSADPTSPIPVYLVQCGLNAKNPGTLANWKRLTVDGKWGSNTDAALRAMMSTAQRPRAGQLAYDQGTPGSSTINLTTSLTALVLDGVTQANCPAPAGMGTHPAGTDPALAPPPPAATPSSGISMMTILISLAALAALGGIGWVLWRKRSSLKRRIKG
jgi:hypothetical protein